jgi:hypothetical protein
MKETYTVNCLLKSQSIVRRRIRIRLIRVLTSAEFLLTIGVAELLTGSSKIKEADFKSLRSDEVKAKLKHNPLNLTLRCLASGIVLRTQETIDCETEIAKEERAAKAALKLNYPIISDVNVRLKHDDSSTALGPGKPKTSPSTPQKRNVSDTSFGSRSLNTTPKKLKKPETHVQHLQNMLVSEIFEALYDSDIRIN